MSVRASDESTVLRRVEREWWEITNDAWIGKAGVVLGPVWHELEYCECQETWMEQIRGALEAAGLEVRSDDELKRAHDRARKITEPFR